VPSLTFKLKPRPPFRLDLTVQALRRRPFNIIDRFDAGTWRRVILAGRAPVGVTVAQIRHGARPEIEVTIDAARPAEFKEQIAAIVTRTLGLELNLSDFYRLARRDRALARLADPLRGLKPVRYPTVFEGFANAVAGQLVSLTAGMHVLNRLADALGTVRRFDGVTMRSFPSASAVARADPATLRAAGLSLPKAAYLIGLARRAIDRHDPDFASTAALDDDAAVAHLSQIRGVGRWTAEYVLLRGFGRIHIFPGDDVGGRNKLLELLGRSDRADYDAVRQIVARWHPYAGLVYLHLVVSGAVASSEDG
jgi:DNA-3-methyladenine glycosylase II